MRQHLSVLALLVFGAMVGNPQPARTAAPIGADRQRIISALRTAKILDSGRVLVYARYVCNLQIEGSAYPVAYFQEDIPGTEIHGYGRTVIFKSNLQIAQVLSLSQDQYPLNCIDNRLYVTDNPPIGNTPPGNNVWTFTDATAEYSSERIDPAKWPTEATLGQFNQTASQSSFGRDNQKIIQALTTAGELHPGRIPTGLFHACNLRVNNSWYPVVFLNEYIPGKSTQSDPRLVILTPRMQIAKVIRDKMNPDPLFCLDNRLYITNQSSPPESDADFIWTFTNGATQFTAKPADRHKWPTETQLHNQFQ